MVDPPVEMDISIETNDDSDELSKYRNKGDGEKSAIASHAVRQHLANFILSRRPSQDQGDSDRFRSSSGNIIGDCVHQLEQDEEDEDGEEVVELYERSKSSFNSQDQAQQSRHSNPLHHSYKQQLQLHNQHHNHNQQQQQRQHLQQHQSRSISKSAIDHRLRKTASLPTMLLSLKVQAASKRRQVERRTTMSPIIKRKVKHNRRAHLEQASSSSTEYSSNPCIDQAIRAAVGARSPTPPLLHNLSLESTSNLNGNCYQNNSINTNQQQEINNNHQVEPNHRTANPSTNQNNNNSINSNCNNNLEKLTHMRVNQALRMAVIQRATSKGKIIGPLSSSFDLQPNLKLDQQQSQSTNLSTNSNNNNPSTIHHQSSLDEFNMAIALRNKPQQQPAQVADYSVGSILSVYRDKSTNVANVGQPTPLSAGGVQQQQLNQIPELKQAQQQQQSSTQANQQASAINLSEETMTLLANRLRHRFSSSSSSISSLFSQQNESSLDDSGSQPIDLSSSTEASRFNWGQQMKSNINSNNNHNSNSNRQNLLSGIKQMGNEPAKAAINQQQYHKILQESFNQLQLRQSHENMLLIQQACQQKQQQLNQTSNNDAIKEQPSNSLLMKTIQFGATRDVSSLDNPKGAPQINQTSGAQTITGSFFQPLATQHSGPSCNVSNSEQILLGPSEPMEQDVSRHELSHLLAQYHSPMASNPYGQEHSQAQSFELFNRWLSVYSTYIGQQQQDANWPDNTNSSDGNNDNEQLQHQFGLDASSSVRFAAVPATSLAGSDLNSSLRLHQRQQMLEFYAARQASAVANMNQQHQQQQQSNLLARGPLPVGRMAPQSMLQYQNQLHQQHPLGARHRLNSMARTLSSPILVSTGPVSSTAGQSARYTGHLQGLAGHLISGENSASQQQQSALAALNLFQYEPARPISQESAYQTSEKQAPTSTTLDNLSRIYNNNDKNTQIRASDQSDCDNKRGGDISDSEARANLFVVDMQVDEDDEPTTKNTHDFSHKQRAMTSRIGELGAIRDEEKQANLMVVVDASDRNLFCSFKELEALRLSSFEPQFDPSSSTGITFDRRLCNHRCICGKDEQHPENCFRILAIWARLHDRRLLERCARVSSREATFDEIKLIHNSSYACYFGLKPEERLGVADLNLNELRIPGLVQLECGGQGVDMDTFWNEEMTPHALRLAAGSVIESVSSVARGHLLNSFAIVRPPGLHAEPDQTNGFCFFNSLAIAAKILIQRFHLKRVLIVDWDVHHGNGIQKAFYEDQKVVYISLHRHDKGSFFPGTGAPEEFGQGYGIGYNWNIAWSDATMGDAEYLAAFRSIVMPIARQFDPSMVLVACGFDAASGHPKNFGGYDISAACFAVMTRQLMTLANGRIVLCLEGGFQLNVICECAEACLRTLLNDKDAPKLEQISEHELTRRPCQEAKLTLKSLSSVASKFWHSVDKWSDTIDMSVVEAANCNNQ